MSSTNLTTEWITVIAPGRAELLGNHTDYNNGLVISLAINHYIEFKSRKLKEHLIKVTAQDSDGDKIWIGSLDDLSPQTENTWVNYIIGVIVKLQDTGCDLGGIEIRFKNNIPIGAGLSSSAALEAATLLTFRRHYPFDMSKFEMAQICQWAENNYAGVQCGLLDPLSVLASCENCLNYIDFENLTLQNISFPNNYTLVLVHSGVSHALVDGDYNERRQSCEQVASLMNKPSLRQVSKSELQEAYSTLPERLYKRTYHIVEENNRVKQARDHLMNHDMQKFGNLLFESHDSSMHHFENSCPELDTLVAFSKNHPACLGARLSGGGFGGMTINLVYKDQSRTFVQAISNHYQSKYGKLPKTLITQPAAGAY